jgi:3-oxoacyl-[acyl-carrier protein] reductase
MVGPGSHEAVAVIGAFGGIGHAVTSGLEQAGWRPVLAMDRPEMLPTESSSAIVPLPIDLANPDAIDNAIEAARKHSLRIKALVVTAGIVDTTRSADLSHDRWAEILAVNLTGVFFAVQASLTWLADDGRIVLLGSLAGRTGGVITGPAYAASKGGIESLTKSLAQDLAPRRITVNCVAPGAIETPMTANHPPERKAAMDEATPLKRHGLPEEVAAAVAFLLSDGAAYITGATIPINGGIRMD